MLLLTLCFAGTAITINLTYQEKEILLIDGKEVEDNLHRKEAVVASLFNDSELFSRLRSIEHDYSLQDYVINDLGNKSNIYLYTYSNNDLVFWGSEQIVPRSDAGIREGSSVISWKNGWFEAQKKSSGGFSVVCLIPIKANYSLSNRYLVNEFSSDLINTPNLDVASYDDRFVYNLRNSDGEYLLSLKLRSSVFNTFYSRLELIMWLLFAFTATLLVTSICTWIAKKGWVKSSILLLAIYLFGVRYLDLKTQWLAENFYSGFFDPKIYASSSILPSLGALAFHVFAATWLICYIYQCRFELVFFRTDRKSSRFTQILVFLTSGALLYICCEAAVYIFESLIVDSSISFEVNNLLNLNIYSWSGIFLLCLVVFCFYLLIETLIVIIKRLDMSRRDLFLFSVAVVVLCLVIKLQLRSLSISAFLMIAIVYLKGWTANISKRFNLALFVVILFLFAGIASLKQSAFQNKKNLSNQLLALQKLESSEDPDAVLLFMEIEESIVNDHLLEEYFLNQPNTPQKLIREELRSKYFGGYLAKYDFHGYAISTDSANNSAMAMSKFTYYKDKVISGSRKISKNFYRLSHSIGYINYFALLPIRHDDEMVGTYLIELKNRSLGRYTSSLELLFSGTTVDSPNEYENYSYAYYSQSELKTQHGSYQYPVNAVIPSSESDRYMQYTSNGYNHIFHSPNDDDLLILSSKAQSGWQQLASLSFLFLVFLVFSILIYTVQWIVSVLNDYDFSFRNFRWSVIILQNRILYSTRIQAFVVLAVVGTLVIVGFISFFSLSGQYKVRQENAIIRQISQIARGVEAKLSVENKDIESINIEQQFSTTAEVNATDLNLYNLSGELLYSTQSKIFDLGLISEYMNANAWLNMHDYKREEFVHHESIGGLDFLTAYTPLKNDRNETIAFLALPYYSNQKDLDQQVGLLLNTIINVYALVLVILGLFAVFVANKITAPLTLVQKSLAKTNIGKKNEPIFWKRNDEIGSLIKEYNNMLVALDNSADQIMRSERESAWREMAKQVAHEIKNPLTPLRLGVQLLERSWKEQDPNFDEKFKRFTQSFIEQIESLNHIASEFSNFAKMPDTKLDDVKIIDMIEKAIDLHSENPQINIEFDSRTNREILVHGDQDQLLRSFNNLIKNSIEACVGQPQCKMKIITEIKRPGYLSITVQDFGKGIDELVQARIFQPNFTTKSSGTGLGLAFVKQAIETMRGTITFKTKKGVGTTFFITMPIKSR